MLVCKDGPREPTEIESEIVKSSEIMSDTVSVRVNHGEQIFATRLHKRFITDWITPAIQSVIELHVFLHVEENERAESFPLASCAGVLAELLRIVHSLVDLLAFLGFPVLPAGKTTRREQFRNWLQR
jgi:hypothetical protein